MGTSSKSAPMEGCRPERGPTISDVVSHKVGYDSFETAYDATMPGVMNRSTTLPLW